MGYAVVVALLSLAGAAVPLRFRPGHAQLQVYLSLAAGALLGAALFHLLPESTEHIGGGFGLPTALGVAVIFFLQRYVAPHSHEPAIEQVYTSHGGHDDHHDHGHDDEHHHGGAHDHAGTKHARERLGGAGPFLGGMVAIAALSLHSFFDGVAIGAATSGGGTEGGTLVLAVFLSVLVHKPMDGLSVSVLLLNAGTSLGKLWLIQVVYAMLVPIGAWAFLVTRGTIADPSPLVGYTLALSAGMFLAIALTDLLPELHFHSHDRNKLSAALLLGLGVMWVTSLFGHAHGHGESTKGHDHRGQIEGDPHDEHEHGDEHGH